ncbi:MAG: hypothetical protein MJ202_09945 [Lentisphaeria bacterium]|nr:hypothetical protein [Lentisphaeria bacterium]
MRNLFAFLFAVLSFCGFSRETLEVDFGRDRSAVVASVAYAPEGTITDGSLAVGAKGFSLPAVPLFGDNCGTLLFRCRFDKPGEPLNTLRNLVNIRTNSRLTVGFHYFSHGKLVFSFTDRDKSYGMDFPDSLEPGRDYSLGFSWDGAKVRVFLDGRVVGEGEQPLPMEKLGNLNIGPYTDAWIATSPWCDDTHLLELRTFDQALTPQQVADFSGVEFKPLAETHPMMISIPPVPQGVQPPDGDGRLTEAAWQYAASFPRLVQGTFPLESGALPHHNFKLTYDEKNLYVGFMTHFPPHMPFVEGDQRTPEKEPEVWGSESTEIYIENDALYRFAGNMADGFCEMRGSDATWNGAWTFHTSRAMKIDDSIVWEGEMVIPWATIGLDGPPQKKLRINCCRSWKLPDFGQHSSFAVDGEGYTSEALIDAHFGPCATLQVTKHSNPNDGEYQQEFSICSAKGGKVTYDLSVGKLDGSAVPISLYNRTWTLKANEPYADKQTCTIGYTDYDCLIYTLSENGQTAFRQIVPYKLNDSFLTLVPLFFQGKIRIQLKEAVMKSKLGADFAGTFQLLDPEGGCRGTVASDASPLELPFDRDWTAGEYRIVLVNAQGEELSESKVFYPGHGEWEELEFPTDIIIPPFTPMETVTMDDGFSSSLALRKYTWKKNALPTQVTSLDEELLAAPIDLLIGGTPAQCTGFQTGQVKPHRVDFSAKGDLFTCASWLEYDGIQWNQVTVTPQKETSLALRFTVPNRFAKYLHCAAVGAVWGAKTTMALPPGVTTLHYYPVLWIGNEEKGFCFFSETKAGWNHPTKESFRIEKGEENTTVTIFIADRLSAGKSAEYAFGFLGTPIRPFASNYPYDTLGWSYAGPMNRDYGRPVSDVNYIEAPYGVPLGDLGSYFADTNDADGNARANAYLQSFKHHSEGHRIRPFPYLCGRYLSSKYPEMMAYKAEWSFRPELAQDYDGTGHMIYDCCPASSASAFFAWKCKKLLERYPQMKGLYFDFGNAPECSNEEHGCHGGLPLLAQREFYRRMALVQLQAGIESPVIVLHNTDCNMLPIYTFATHLLNGEHIRQQSSPILHNKKDILDTYGIEMFASELSSLPFGITNSVYMPLDTLRPEYGGDEKTDAYQFRLGKAEHAATLIHNTIICLWRNHYGIFDKFIRVFDRFGVGEPQTRFVGYWRNPAKVTGASDIYVSCHVNGDKVLAVVGHVGKPHVNQTFDITFDWKTLGVQNPPTHALDTMTADDPEYAELFERQKKFGVPPERAPIELGDFGSKVLSFQGDTLRMSLDFHSFAIIELQ